MGDVYVTDVTVVDVDWQALTVKLHINGVGDVTLGVGDNVNVELPLMILQRAVAYAKPQTVNKTTVTVNGTPIDVTKAFDKLGTPPWEAKDDDDDEDDGALKPQKGLTSWPPKGWTDE